MSNQPYVIGVAEIDSFDIWNLLEDADTVVGITELQALEGCSRLLRARSRGAAVVTSSLSKSFGVDDQVTEDIFGRSRVTATMIIGIIRELSGDINGSTTINPVPINSMLAGINGSATAIGSLDKETHDPIEWDDVLGLSSIFPSSPTDGQVFVTGLIAESDLTGTKSRPSTWVYNQSLDEWQNRAATVVGSHRITSSSVLNQNVPLDAEAVAGASFTELTLSPNRFVDQGTISGSGEIIYDEGRFFSFDSASTLLNGVIGVSITGSSSVTGQQMDVNFALGGGIGRDTTLITTATNTTFEVAGRTTVVADLLESTNYINGLTIVTGELNRAVHHPLGAMIHGSTITAADLKFDWEISGVLGQAVIRQVEQPIIENSAQHAYVDGVFVANPNGLQYAADGSPLEVQQFQYEITAVDVFNDLPTLTGYVIGGADIKRPDPLVPEASRLASTTYVDERELFVDYVFTKDAGRANGKSVVASIDMGVSTTRYHQDINDMVYSGEEWNIPTADDPLPSLPASPGIGDVVIVRAEDTGNLVLSVMWNGTNWVSNAPDGTYYDDEAEEGGRYR